MYAFPARGGASTPPCYWISLYGYRSQPYHEQSERRERHQALEPAHDQQREHRDWDENDPPELVS